jgi:hypothetical protein
VAGIEILDSLTGSILNSGIYTDYPRGQYTGEYVIK